jgi:hypothetical protein
MALSYREEEERVQEALEWYLDGENRSFEGAAAQFNIPIGRIRRRYHGTQSRSSVGGRNKALSDEQERALLHWIDKLDEIGVPLRLSALTSSANGLLRRAHSSSDANPPPQS